MHLRPTQADSVIHPGRGKILYIVAALIAHSASNITPFSLTDRTVRVAHKDKPEAYVDEQDKVSQSDALYSCALNGHGFHTGPYERYAKVPN